MKRIKIILHILQDLFVILMFIFSVCGCFLMWTDAEYANYIIKLTNMTMGNSQPSADVTMMHRVFFTVLLLVFDIFLIYILAYDNFIKKLKANKGHDK